MKLGLNQWAFTAAYSTERAIRLTSEMGYESIEVCAGEDGPISFKSNRGNLAAIRKHANALGLEISSVACASGWLYPVTAIDEEVRERGVRATIRAMEIAHELHVDTIVIVPGKVSIEAYFDVAFANARTAFQRLIPEAERLGVTIALENVRNNFLLSPVEMIHFLDQFGSPYVKACLNTGNLLSHGHPEQWVQKLGKRIQRVHMKDYKTGSTVNEGIVPLGTGDVNWPMVMRALHNVGYSGALTADVTGAKSAPETVIHEALVQLRKLRALLPA
ncbi:MAG: sugar phosphate isomerase/epimerase [Candidatus Hydrogenedentes bacterium]|nr:sugar phosphate isomerase/epimerase [Candidatus Hydrogenedentota bacterium]